MTVLTRIIKLTIEYDGTDYHGWQIQPNLKTVQGEIEKALKSLTQKDIRVIASGRTDTGVHALEQVASFRYDGMLDMNVFKKGLNGNLPRDIRILAAEEAPENFDARYSAVKRTYHYVIAKSERAIGRQYVWHPPFLFDLALMEEASQFLLGEHDFSSFAKPRIDDENTISVVYDVKWDETGEEIFFNITAIRFFHSMIRLIMGTLMDVGRQVITPLQFKEILEAKDLSRASAKAPASGLFLVNVEY